jgi:glycosyltransferase involved in cell wall biosynthesis
MKSKTEKFHVLVFIDWFLPGDKAGGPVRSCANLIDHLGNEFEFSVITRDTDYTDAQPMRGIKSNVWNILADEKRVYYISNDQLNKTTIERLLREEKYDAVYLNGIWSQPFTAWPLLGLKKLKKNVRVVVATRGMLAPSALAIKATKKKLFLRFAKIRGLFSNVIFHATTEKEAQEIKNAFGNKSEVLVAGNLPRKISEKTEHTQKVKGKVSVVSIARIAPEKNTLYTLEVLSKIKVPIAADFFGSVYDENYWNECKKIIDKLPANIQINFPGALPSEEITKTLSKYDLLFLPTRGENFGHIILESLQAGTPVLISDQTPWKNLVNENAGWDLSLQSQESFVDVIEMIAGMNEKDFLKWMEGAEKLGEKYSSDRSVFSPDPRNSVRRSGSGKPGVCVANLQVFLGWVRGEKTCRFSAVRRGLGTDSRLKCCFEAEMIGAPNKNKFLADLPGLRRDCADKIISD